MAIKVYDWQGNLRDMTYLRSKYGNFRFQAAAAGDGPAYKISILREKINAAATLVVRVTGENGQPLDAVRVAWYWPDAPHDPGAGPLGGVLPEMTPNRCVTGLTNVSGDAGFGMGQGAYYWPGQGQIGPHAAWIHGASTRSDVILGLGMAAATNHDHFDVEFTRLSGDEPPEPPGPGDECPTEEILTELQKIDQAMANIRRLLAG